MSGWIRTLPSGKTQACWRDGAGQQRSRSFDKRATAKQYLASVQAELQAGTYVDPHGPRTPLADWYARWRPSYNTRGRATQHQLDSRMRSRVLPRFGHRTLGEIRTLDLRTWVAELHNEGLAPTTIRDLYGALRLVLGAAVEERLIHSSPCTLKPTDFPRDDGKLEHYLTAQDIRQLAATVPPRYRALILAAGWTGARWGELTALRWNRVDLDQRRIVIDTAAQDVAGKLTFGPPKNAASTRVIVLDPRTVDALREHRDAYPSDGLVFTAPDGGPLRHGTFTASVWNARVRNGKTAPSSNARKRAGLPEGVTFHDLRHSHASLMIAAGMDILTLSRRLGHARPSMTLDRYGHLMRHHDQITLEAIARAQTDPQEQTT